MQLIIFTQINHSSIDARQRRTKDILNIFQKRSVFGLGDHQFREYRFTQTSCAKV